MRIIWKQWGQQRFSYWLSNNKMNLSTDNSNIRVVIEFWFRFVFFFLTGSWACCWCTQESSWGDRLRTDGENHVGRSVSSQRCTTARGKRCYIYKEVYKVICVKDSTTLIDFHLNTDNQAETTRRFHRPEFQTSSEIHSVQFTKFFILYANMLLWQVAFISPLRLDM